MRQGAVLTYRNLALLFVLAISAGAQESSVPIGDFAWLSGHWEGKLAGGECVEQDWTSSRNDQMMGMFRLWKGEEILLLEFFNLRPTDAGLQLTVRHFTPDLVPLEEGDAIVLIGHRDMDRRWLFENPYHSRPKWSYITRIDDGSYQSRSVILDEDGTERFIEVLWLREGSSDNLASCGAE